MKDIFFKFKILYWLILDTCGTWKAEVWKRDLDERFCCDGRDCACGGMTVKDSWECCSKPKRDD